MSTLPPGSKVIVYEKLELLKNGIRLMDNEREVKRMEKKSFLEIDNILINLDNVYEIRISADNKVVIFYFISGGQSSIAIDRTNQDLIPKLRSMCV
ncbi:MAG: hypothetical protein E7493_04695 [Ruminococcus albus]|nr:hypothetical protein [Ruminococcus albus]